MILCSHFLWFCDVETDVTNRDLTPNHSLVGGSSTSHCATPVLVNLQKIQGEEMSPFNSPCTDTPSSFPGVQPSCRAFLVHLKPSPRFKDKDLHWSLPVPGPRLQEQGRMQVHSWAPQQWSGPWAQAEQVFISVLSSQK